MLPLFGRGESKLARGIRGRRGAVERLERWAHASRDLSRPLAWFHAPSVGEGFQARAVIEALISRRPDLQVVYTYFSPSAEPFARKLPVDVADYLPLDLPSNAVRLFAALRPDAVAFTKTEVWPNIVREAVRRGVPVTLLSATLPRSSSRTGRLARAFLTPAHSRLDRVAAISIEDAKRFAALGVQADRTLVMGDARFDQVWRRASAASETADLIEPLRDPERLTVVAGSTWPADEDLLIGAFARLFHANRRLRSVVVPHEPTPDHLARLERKLGEHALGSARLSEGPAVSRVAVVLIVDRVGVLGDLYRLADVAYVGGGFGDAGLHSVLEPAAFGVPVLFGPHHSNAREAGELVAAGGARSVGNCGELASVLESLLSDEERRRSVGRAAREYVQHGLGAADRGAELVLSLVARA